MDDPRDEISSARVARRVTVCQPHNRNCESTRGLPSIEMGEAGSRSADPSPHPMATPVPVFNYSTIEWQVQSRLPSSAARPMACLPARLCKSPEHVTWAHPHTPPSLPRNVGARLGPWANASLVASPSNSAPLAGSIHWTQRVLCTWPDNWREQDEAMTIKYKHLRVDWRKPGGGRRLLHVSEILARKVRPHRDLLAWSWPLSLHLVSPLPLSQNTAFAFSPRIFRHHQSMRGNNSG